MDPDFVTWLAAVRETTSRFEAEIRALETQRADERSFSFKQNEVVSYTTSQVAYQTARWPQYTKEEYEAWSAAYTALDALSKRLSRDIDEASIPADQLPQYRKTVGQGLIETFGDKVVKPLAEGAGGPVSIVGAVFVVALFGFLYVYLKK